MESGHDDRSRKSCHRLLQFLTHKIENKQMNDTALKPTLIGPDKVMDVRPIPCSIKHGMIIRAWQNLFLGDYFILLNDHDPAELPRAPSPVIRTGMRTATASGKNSASLPTKEPPAELANAWFGTVASTLPMVSLHRRFQLPDGLPDRNAARGKANHRPKCNPVAKVVDGCDLAKSLNSEAFSAILN